MRSFVTATAAAVLAAVLATSDARADDTKTDDTKSSAHAVRAQPVAEKAATGPVAVAAALRRIDKTRVKEMSDTAGANDGTAMDVTRSESTTQATSSDLSDVHTTGKSATGVVAGTAREVRIEAEGGEAAAAPKIAASPRQVRHMNVERVVASLSLALQQCADAAPPGKAATGTAVIATEVGAGGVVESTDVASSGGLSDDVLACIQHQLQDAKFGRPGGSAVVVSIRVGVARSRSK